MCLYKTVFEEQELLILQDQELLPLRSRAFDLDLTDHLLNENLLYLPIKSF
jgi:hypothetical protein